MVPGAIITMSTKLIQSSPLLSFLLLLSLVSFTASGVVPLSALPKTVGYPVLDPASGQVLAQVKAETTLWGPESRRTRLKKMMYLRLDKGDPHGKDPQGGEISQVVETLAQDPKGQLVNYHYLDPQTGEQLDVAVDHGKAKVVSQSSHKGSPVHLSLPWTSKSLVGAQIADYIQDHWAVLESGKPLSFELFVPFRRGFFTFQAESSPMDSKGRIRVKVLASSWMIRAFAPSIELEYQCASPGGSCRGASPDLTLVAYKGPSPLELQGSRHPTVRLDLSQGTPVNP